MGVGTVLVNKESLPEDCHQSQSLKEVGEPTVGSSGGGVERVEGTAGAESLRQECAQPVTREASAAG